jgi:hypothetical protein
MYLSLDSVVAIITAKIRYIFSLCDKILYTLDFLEDQDLQDLRQKIDKLKNFCQTERSTILKLKTKDLKKFLEYVDGIYNHHNWIYYIKIMRDKYGDDAQWGLFGYEKFLTKKPNFQQIKNKNPGNKEIAWACEYLQNDLQDDVLEQFCEDFSRLFRILLNNWEKTWRLDVFCRLSILSRVIMENKMANEFLEGPTWLKTYPNDRSYLKKMSKVISDKKIKKNLQSYL